MTATEELRTKVRAVLEKDPAINLHQYPIRIDVRDDGVLVLEGEVEDIIAKRLIPHLAATIPEVNNILDRLRIIPSERRGDGAILDSVYENLTQEPAFKGCVIRIQGDSRPDAGTASAPESAIGVIEIAVTDGVVILTGWIESLSHKRLADVLAWWARGSVDVDNRLRVVPPEQDTDDEITDALRMVLEKDPWLDAGQIWTHTRDRIVVLEGLVHSQEQKHMAECDAWYILGVHRVANHIQVRP